MQISMVLVYHFMKKSNKEQQKYFCHPKHSTFYPISWETVTNSRFFRRCSARGSNTGLCRIGPIKVKASNKILFIEGSPEVGKIEHLFDKVKMFYLNVIFIKHSNNSLAMVLGP